MGKLKDRSIECKGCGSTFILTAGEQRFYKDKKLQLPSHCPDCRERRRIEKIEREGENEERKEGGIPSTAP